MGSTRKVPLTLTEHEAIGEALYRIRTTLVSISVWVGNTYRHDKMRYVTKMEKQLDAVRSTLDNQVYQEFPERGHPANAHVYYRGSVSPLDTSTMVWDVQTICEHLAQWANELRLIAQQLFQAYPVALGDRVLRIADLLAYEAIELPFHLGQPKRRRR
jgi:hypothetical protein